MKIHHVGIAVKSAEEAAARFGALLGLEKGARYELPELGVTALFLPVADSNLELLEPIGEDSTVAKFLEERGEGLHHVCFEVDDIEASREKVAGAGLSPTPVFDFLETRVPCRMFFLEDPDGNRVEMIEYV